MEVTERGETCFIISEESSGGDTETDSHMDTHTYDYN